MGMNGRTFVLIMGIAVLVFTMTISPVFSQYDMTHLSDEAFGEGQRPPAVFNHEEHNEIAEIYECNVCHHMYKDGQLLEYESSEDMRCSDCHNVKEGYPTRPLMDAYHDMCKGCHQERGAGPITCGECHPRDGGASSHNGGH